MAFAVSSAKVDITPTLAQNPYMAGYGMQDEPRTATSSGAPYDALMARCAILWEDGYPHAIVSVDVLGIPRAMNLAIRQRLLPLASWSNGDISINANHTHNGPALVDVLSPFSAYDMSDLTIIRSYSKSLEDKIVGIVQQALAATRTSVTLSYTVTSATFAFNRVGLSTRETAVPILMAKASNGTPRAIIWSYGCHAVSAGMQEQWDGDWPAGACASLEDNYGSSCIALFLQGPAGDQDPSGAWGWSLRNTYADAIYAAVRNAVNAGGRAVTGPMRTSYTDVSMPLDTTLSLASARSQYVGRFGNPDGQPAWYQRHAELMVGRIDSGTTETAILNPLGVWKFTGGTPLRVAFVGGEVVSAYGAWARNNYGGTAQMMFCAYGNEVSCYVPDQQFLPGGAFSDGSYEGGWEPDYPGIAGGSMTVYPHIYRFSSNAPLTLLNSMAAALA